MSSFNQVVLVGNLARDPEVKTSPSGQKFANMTVVTSERWKDKTTGESKEKAEFHKVAVFNENLAAIAERYLHKGSQCMVTGQLQTRKWTDQEGRERYSTEIVLSRFRGELVLLGSGNGADRSSGPDRLQGRQPDQVRTAKPPAHLDLDDDIPFAWLGALIAPGLALLALGGLA